jgi:hypothetical protein
MRSAVQATVEAALKGILPDPGQALYERCGRLAAKSISESLGDGFLRGGV